MRRTVRFLGRARCGAVPAWQLDFIDGGTDTVPNTLMSGEVDGESTGSGVDRRSWLREGVGWSRLGN